MSILKELNKSKKAMLQEENEILSSVKLLMDSDAAEDLRISNALGSNHSLARAQVMVGKKIELENLDKGYGGNVFKIEDIKRLCIKYHLRFLKTQHFAGHLDIEVFAKLKEFAKETSIQITDGNLERKFYILAPDESFNLNSERLPRVSDDPAIFYKIDEDHYRLIHKWGADFTPMRYVKGLFWRNSRLTYWMTVALVASALAILSYFLINFFPSLTFDVSPVIFFASCGVFTIFSFISPFFFSPLLNTDISDTSILCSNKTWDSSLRNY